jgi:hypothetical protein
MMQTPEPPTAMPFGALLDHLQPAARAAYHHERRRGRSEIEALTFGVVLPDVVEALMIKGTTR